MQTTRSALHPLLTVAAISVTVLSAAGVAALTGLIPASVSSTQQPAAIEAIEAPQPVPAAPAASPVIKRPVVRKAAPIVRAEAPSVVEPAKPVQIGILGVVDSVREVKDPGAAKGVGAVAGGVAGAVLGHQFGNGSGKKLLTVLGAAGGAFAGNHVEKQVRATKHWELTVRLDDGTTRTLNSDVEPFWHAGDRVRMVDGKLQPV